MTLRNIEMTAGDAALILRANGDIEALIPKPGDDGEEADNVALAMAFTVVARSPVLSHIVVTMAETETAFMADYETATPLPEVTQ